MTTTTSIEIIPASIADIGLVAGLIAAAFHTLAVARWQIPDDHLRRAVYPAMFEDHVRHGLEHGSVEITEDMTAAAVWVSEPGLAKPAPKPPTGRLAAALANTAKTVHLFDLALHEHEPVGTRFEKLALLAVRPGAQNQGLGSALLAYHLTGLDKRLMPAYLEASNEASRALYERFGFLDHGRPIQLPRGPLMYPQWREPRGIQPQN